MDLVGRISIMQFESEYRMFVIGVVNNLKKIMITPRSTNCIKQASCLNQKRLSEVSQQNLVKQFIKLVLDLTVSKIISTDEGFKTINKF